VKPFDLSHLLLPNGLSESIKYSHSPSSAELRTFRLTFSLRHLKARQRLKIKAKRSYRNPVALAGEWQAALENGECSSAAELACKLGVSRARVSQVLRLLRLSPKVLSKIEGLGDPLPKLILTERKLRPIVELSPAEQERWMETTSPNRP